MTIDDDDVPDPMMTDADRMLTTLALIEDNDGQRRGLNGQFRRCRYQDMIAVRDALNRLVPKDPAELVVDLAKVIASAGAGPFDMSTVTSADLLEIREAMDGVLQNRADGWQHDPAG
jgi:hypothetical protein